MSEQDFHYRGWRIYYERHFIVGHLWTFVHDEYDGPEDNRCGTASTADAAKEAVDEREDEWGIDP